MEHTTTNQTEIGFTPIVGMTAQGDRVWYTGRAGAGFVSASEADAFQGYSSVDGARHRALLLNRGTALHGIRFAAVTGDLLEMFW